MDLENVDAETAAVDRNVIQGRDPLKIGVSIGEDCSGPQIEMLREQGVSVFQIMGRFYKSGDLLPPPSWMMERIDGCEVTIHMPFYFQLLKKITPAYLSMFRQLDAYWGSLQDRTDVIVHCKGVRKPRADTLCIMRNNLCQYSRLVKNLRLVMENDAGGKENPAVKLRHISKIKEELNGQFNVGFCLDTQHAYAAGEPIVETDIKTADMIHLNAVPKNVRFGGHLDRHSYTPLLESKNGTRFVDRIIEHSLPGTPLILERMSLSVVLKDLHTIKEIQNRCGLKLKLCG